MDDLFDLSKALITVCIACSLLTMLFYKTNLYQSVRFICSIIVIAYMIRAFMPLYCAVAELINTEQPNAPEISDESNDPSDEYVNHVSVGICKSVKSVICSRYCIPEDDLKVSVTVNNDEPQNIVIKSVTVTLEKAHSDISADISRYVADMLGCGCTVIIK
ncbi:MAG: hypothetical protein E7634_00565 [Ruminococcaceae bacterium]|nr:hypothetical protein [Oscillospiraceae bacterium]